MASPSGQGSPTGGGSGSGQAEQMLMQMLQQQQQLMMGQQAQLDNLARLVERQAPAHPRGLVDLKAVGRPESLGGNLDQATSTWRQVELQVRTVAGLPVGKWSSSAEMVRS